jgi:dihydrofolate reductase
MRQQTRSSKEPAEKVVQDIRRTTRKQYSAEEKIRIVGSAATISKLIEHADQAAGLVSRSVAPQPFM